MDDEQKEIPAEFRVLDDDGNIVNLRETEHADVAPTRRVHSLGEYVTARKKDIDGLSVYDAGAPREVAGEHRIPTTTPSKVIQAYEDFFAMGSKRSLVKLARQYKAIAEEEGIDAVPCISYPTLKKWSNKYRWDLQVRHDELVVAEQVRESRVDNAKEMVGRVSRSMKILQTVGLQYVRQFVDANGNLTQKAMEELSPGEARRFIVEAARLEKELYIESPEIAAEDEEELYF